jgi:hypothetical protein
MFEFDRACFQLRRETTTQRTLRPAGAEEFNYGGFYKHGVPTGLDAVSLGPPKSEMQLPRLVRAIVLDGNPPVGFHPFMIKAGSRNAMFAHRLARALVRVTTYRSAA